MSRVLHTFVTTLLSPTPEVHLDKVTVEQETVRLQLTATAPHARCPHCAVPSSSVHSRYQRHLTDLPWGTRPVRIQLTMRKFVCQNPGCERHIFTGRLPAFMAAHARKTQRLVTALRAIGMALGEQAGARLARWITIYETLHRLYAQGTPIATMARRLGISRPTVYAYLRRDTPPGPRRLQRRPSAPHIPYLIRRWWESGADSRQLWREIRALGFAHSARTVCHFITRLRRASEGGYAPESQGSPYTRPQGPSARAVSFVMVCPAAHRSDDAQRYLDPLCQVDARIARAHTLVQAFLAMVRERRGHGLEAWIAQATSSGIKEVARFARGLQDDLAAMKAGLTLAWNNGVTEGQIHRLKFLKRQGYGRAGFALLQQRVLHAA